MGQGKQKNPQVEAPVVNKPEVKVDETKVENNNASMPDSMSQHDKVLYTSVIQHRKDEMLRVGGENAEKYEALTMIEDAMILDVAVTEAVVKRNPAGLIMCVNEKNWKALQLLAKDSGVTLPDYKNLPKPTKEQLALAGIAAAPGQVLLKLENKDVSAEAKEKKKAEQKLVDDANSGKKEYLKDHTKIETDDQLKEALEFQLVNPAVTNPIDRLIQTTQFYRSYLEARAEKSDNPEVELAKIHEFTLADLLQDITTMVKPTFVTAGFGKRLCTLAEDANSVIPAFCGFKNCVLNRKTGKYAYSDAEIAAFVRVLIVWYASSKSAEMSEAITKKEADIKLLKKDEKANAKGIETETKKIAGLKSGIAHFTNMISLVTDPSFDIIDDFIGAYKNKENAHHMYATVIAKEILNTYYRNVEIPELEFDSMLLNVQQIGGIILNLFSSPIAKRDEYSEKNIIEFKAAESEEKKDAEEKEGEEVKN